MKRGCWRERGEGKEKGGHDGWRGGWGDTGGDVGEDLCDFLCVFSEKNALYLLVFSKSERERDEGTEKDREEGDRDRE